MQYIFSYSIIHSDAIFAKDIALGKYVALIQRRVLRPGNERRRYVLRKYNVLLVKSYTLELLVGCPLNHSTDLLTFSRHLRLNDAVISRYGK